MYKGEIAMWQTMSVTDVRRKLRTNIDYGLNCEEARKKIKNLWRK